MDLQEIIKKYALHNAVMYDGRVDVKAVMGKIMAENPELTRRAKEVLSLVKEIVNEINKMGIDEQRKELEKIAPELLEVKKKEEKKELEDLPEVQVR